MESDETAESPAVEDSKTASGRRRGHVMIFGMWCKGCGICVEFCPKGVFEMNGLGRPEVARPEACTACMWCVTHCPDMAITVRRLDEDEAEELEELVELAEQGALPAGGDL
jgi:2-oxoglutarate ferredoxin oxidoreductase subunit delta